MAIGWRGTFSRDLAMQHTQVHVANELKRSAIGHSQVAHVCR